ncbi:MAG: DUF87 domain-containing protein [Chloroflexi bacterium]|nr:DUF87 domain-containing protein [Chloroflexota bacterium]
MAEKTQFYLGRLVDPAVGKPADAPLLYDPEDLTTHAVVVGMTGSGKTGLCICLLEEAALQGIPALMIDPKGDITNSLLHFPDMTPENFLPWIDADQARREGKTPEQAAAETAENWKSGLAQWGIGPERIQALKDSAQFTVFTPGSDAGVQVSILASLQAPDIPWEGNRELLREKIKGTVTALLGLTGMADIDPIRSREHVLLSNIFEHAWSQGKDLDLEQLILQTQNPPFTKLGVFDVNTFFPEKDRLSLAMMLNNIIAAPGFQTWLEGEPLDVARLLYTPDGRPRHSIFYIAHLNDAERMFFVTLLYSAVESWMRTQPGSTTLKALIYFDEIFGYLPPTANPPSKEPMLRMLKQARAFGVGQVLATQNPVDVDYKALSNAGSWFIGKLQTDQDKQRLLDGLQGAAPANMDRAKYDRLISGLGKRVFLLHNVHNPDPLVFQTRWAMNYLAGPLTRSQIPALNRLAGTSAHFPAQAAAGTAPVSQPAAGIGVPAVPRESEKKTKRFLEIRPVVPSGTMEYFLPNNLPLTRALQRAGHSSTPEAGGAHLVYRPALLAQASVRFLNRKYNLDTTEHSTALVSQPDRRGVVRWEDWSTTPLDPAQLDRSPDPRAHFDLLEAPLTEAKILNSMQKDFLDWVFRSSQVTVRANEPLKVYAGPDISTAEFRSLCSDAARRQRDAEIDRVSSSYDKKLSSLQTKLEKEQRELEEDQAELSHRKMEEWGTHAENIFGLFGGRRSSRRVSSSLSKRRMTEKARADVEESKAEIARLQKEIQALEAEKSQAIEEINAKWAEVANEVSEITVTPYRKDVFLDLFGVAWVPYYRLEQGGEEIWLPGFSSD